MGWSKFGHECVTKSGSARTGSRAKMLNGSESSLERFSHQERERERERKGKASTKVSFLEAFRRKGEGEPKKEEQDRGGDELLVG